ncbi:MAG: UDP-4-amino-4,6-dideoxy-N-acetyl-beta-L-altrosamine transaminase, partial [Peptococcaceae bacterium]|nr:UDP-4-amino-4,6-dideoxy-N-acetyl-beta-L-altrosamine transaminase [Peptococcaceae bacterium]
ERFLAVRRDYVRKYNEAFSAVEEIETPYQLENTNSAWHLYIIKLKLEKMNCGRRQVFEELNERGIGVNVHYIPVYYHPYYRQLGYNKGLCPRAEELYESIITLPLFPRMEKEDVEYVISNVKEVIQNHAI